MSYEAFAPFYDRVMGDRSADIAQLKEFIREFKPEAKSILELGCGTGQILEGFNDGMHELAGVDNCEEMLNIARDKLPAATFFNADISNLALGKEYDVVLCVFDTINHLQTMAQWRSFFECAQRHMRRGGLFIFDMNTMHKLNAMAANPEASADEFPDGYVQMKVTNKTAGQFDWDIRIFDLQPDKEYKLHKTTVTEVSFPVAEIQSILETYFLEMVVSRDPYTGSVTENSNRVFFICT